MFYLNQTFLTLIENVQDFCKILVHLEVRSTFLPNDRKKKLFQPALLSCYLHVYFLLLPMSE